MASAIEPTGAHLTPLKAGAAKIEGAGNVSASEALTQQPEGTLVKNLFRSSIGYYDFQGSIYYSEINGSATDIVEGEDGNIYLYNPFTQYPFDVWVKLEHQEGDKYTLTGPCYLGETTYNFNQWEVYLCNISFSEEGNISLLSEPLEFTYDGTSLDLADEQMFGLCEYVPDEDKFYWWGYGDKQYSCVKNFFEEVEAPANAQSYLMTFKDRFGREADADDKPFKKFVNVAFDDNHMYIQGLSENDSWAMGKKNGDCYEFPFQWAGVKNYRYAGVMGNYHTFYVPATFEILVDSEGEAYTKAHLQEFIKFAIDEDTKTITGDIALVTNVGDNGFFIDETYNQPVLVPFKSEAAVPANPEIDYYMAYSEFLGKAGFVFYVYPKDVDGNDIDSQNLYYLLYADHQPYVLIEEEYPGVDGVMEEIPWNFRVSGMVLPNEERHVVYTKRDDVSSMGVQALYKVGDTVTYSDIVHSDGTIESSISDISTENAVPVEFYNLSGVKMERPAKGLNLVRMSDGSVRKVIVR